MEPSFADIKKYYNRCRPDEPIAPTDDRWVNLAPLRGAGKDVVSQMLRLIELEERFATLLVTGFRGTGKTSLLKDCQQRLRDSSDYEVVYTDVEADYLVNPYEPITINDVLLTLAMALVDHGLGPGYVKKLWGDIKAFAGTNIVPQEVEVEASGTTFKAVLERTPALHERLRHYAREHALFEQVKQLIVSAQADVRRKSKQGLVVIIDSLDHLSDPAEKEDMPVTTSILKILRDAPELRRLDVHVLLTVPPTILPYAHDLRVDYGEPYIVPEAKILTRKDERDAQAFTIMEQFVAKRVPLECFDSPASACSLIAASGGYLRDLLRLLQHCLADIDQWPISAAVVKRTIDRGVTLSAELPLEDYRDDLKAILQSPDHRLPRDESRLRRMYQMIRDRVILRYINDHHWEGIHPFVMAHVDRPRFERLVFPPSQ